MTWRRASAASCTCSRLGLAVAGDEDRPVGDGGQDRGVGDRQQRRGVEDDRVVALAELLEQVGHLLGAEQLAGVRRDRARGQEVQQAALPAA